MFNVNKVLDPLTNRFNQAKNYTVETYGRSKKVTADTIDWTVNASKKTWTHTRHYGGKAVGYGGTALSAAGTALMKTPTYAKQGHELMKGQPLYQRNVTPLKTFDHIVLGGSLVLTALITIIGIKTLGIAILPIIGWLGMTCILGACTLARHRLNKHFDDLACSQLFKIYKKIDNTTFTQEDNSNIQHRMTEFAKPEFNHRKEKWETLKKEYRSFLKKANQHKFEDSQAIVSTRLKTISTILDKENAEKNLISTVQSLIIEIEKEQEKLDAKKIAELISVISSTHKEILDGFNIQELLLKPPSIKAAKGQFNAIVANIIRELGGDRPFDRQACKELVEIQKRIVNIPFREKDKSNIQNRMTKLAKPEFNHREKNWEILKKEYNSFLNIANQHKLEDNKNIVVTKLEPILSFLKNSNSDKDLINSIENLLTEMQKEKDQLDIKKISSLISEISSYNNENLKNLDIAELLFNPPSMIAAKNHFNSIVAKIITELGGKPYVHNVVNGEKKEIKVEEKEEEKKKEVKVEKKEEEKKKEQEDNINNSKSNFNNIVNNNNNNNNNNIENDGVKIEVIEE